MALNCHLMATKETDGSTARKASQPGDATRPWLVNSQEKETLVFLFLHL